MKNASAGDREAVTENDRDPQHEEAEARLRLGDARAEAEETLEQAEEKDSGSRNGV